LLRAVADGARVGALLLLGLVVRIAALARRHVPVVGRAASATARVTAKIARAYAFEIRRVVREEWTPVAVWLEARRRGRDSETPSSLELLPHADAEPDAAAEESRRRTG
jgi:hypothetical protein